MPSQPVPNPQNYQWAVPYRPDVLIGGVIYKRNVDLLLGNAGGNPDRLIITFEYKSPNLLNPPFYEIKVKVNNFVNNVYISGHLPCPDDCEYHNVMKMGINKTNNDFSITKEFSLSHYDEVADESNGYIGVWLNHDYTKMAIYPASQVSSVQYSHYRDTLVFDS